jgi:hypothetical protein
VPLARVTGTRDGTAIAAQSRVLRVTLIGLLATWVAGLVRLALAASTPAPVRVRARAAGLRDR